MHWFGVALLANAVAVTVLVRASEQRRLDWSRPLSAYTWPVRLPWPFACAVSGVAIYHGITDIGPWGVGIGVAVVMVPLACGRWLVSHGKLGDAGAPHGARMARRNGKWHG